MAVQMKTKCLECDMSNLNIPLCLWSLNGNPLTNKSVQETESCHLLCKLYLGKWRYEVFQMY